MQIKTIHIHGHQVGYYAEGSGPALILVHGIASSSRTWRQVMPRLAQRFTVIAPDLLGHGASAKLRGDYSLGAHASGIRDLMVALGIERATRSATRSAVASRCSSPTSSPSAVSGWSWWTVAGLARRSRCCCGR